MESLDIYLPDFRKKALVLAPKLNIVPNKRKSLAMFWILVAIVSSSMSLLSWHADKNLSRELRFAYLQESHQDGPASSVRNLNFETRSRSGEGVLDETTHIVTGSKVESTNITLRQPSFYCLRLPGKVSKKYQSGTPQLPCSPLAMNRILRI